MNYVLFDTSSGNILQTGVYHGNALPFDGEFGFVAVASIEGIGHQSHWVKDGTVTAYSDIESSLKRAVPTFPCMWSNVHMAWVDCRSFEQIKADALIELKARRDAKEYGPFLYNGMTFDGDLDAQRRISVLVSVAKTALAMGNNFTKEFTLADNTVVQLTAEDFIGIEMAKLWQVDVAFQEYRAKRAAIEAATTLEELDAI